MDQVHTLTGQSVYFLFWLLDMLGLYRVGETIGLPLKNHKETLCLSRFSLTKSAAKVSKEDSRRPPCNHWRRARVSRTRRAWRVRAAKDRAKIGSFALPATSYYHACEHSARKSRADSCTHCLHALPKQEPMLSFLHKYAKAQSTFALSA